MTNKLLMKDIDAFIEFRDNHPDICCENCAFAKNRSENMQMEFGYLCTGHRDCVVFKGDFCSLFVRKSYDNSQ